MLSVIAGVALLCATAVDVFSTVFVPRGGAGWLTSRLYRGFWRAWSAAACAGGHRRRRLLALAGPVLLPLTVALWVAEVVVAFALLYLPFREQLTVPGQESSTWLSALYVSAYSATTLGVGDVYASTGPLRLLVTLEAAIGFALFSASITYVLSVYSALLRATSLALSIRTFLGREADEDGVDLLCRSVRTGSDVETLSWLGQTTIEIAGTSQAQRQYPLVAYFHIPHDDRALPLAMSDLLVLLTVCRGLLDPSEYPSLSSSPTTVAAWRTGAQFVNEHGSELGKGQVADDDGRGRQQYEDARARLVAARVGVRAEPEAQQEFLRLHETWRANEHRLLQHFRYQDL